MTRYAVQDGKASWGGRFLAEWVPDVLAPIIERFDPVKVVLLGTTEYGPAQHGVVVYERHPAA